MSQTTGSTLTEYLIDQQPSLAVVLRQKIGSQNTHYVHNPRGIASQQVGSVWNDAISDGLGSVRGWLNSSQAFTDTNYYDPYGVPDSEVNGFGFTGEMTDDNGLVYLRARYYDPNIGNFVSLDPFEGFDASPMSLNGYSWVEGNPINRTDPSGMYWESITERCNDECLGDPCMYNPYDVIGFDSNGRAILGNHDLTTCRNISSGRDIQVTKCLMACHRYHSGETSPVFTSSYELLSAIKVISEGCIGVIGAVIAAPQRGGGMGFLQKLGWGGLAFYLLWLLSQTRTQPRTNRRDDDDRCDIKVFPDETVFAVINGSPLGDRIVATYAQQTEEMPTVMHGERNTLSRTTVEGYASSMCKGSHPLTIELVKLRHAYMIQDGNHRFVASRLVTKRHPNLTSQIRNMLSKRVVSEISSIGRNDGHGLYFWDWGDVRWV